MSEALGKALTSLKTAVVLMTAAHMHDDVSVTELTSRTHWPLVALPVWQPSSGEGKWPPSQRTGKVSSACSRNCVLWLRPPHCI